MEAHSTPGWAPITQIVPPTDIHPPPGSAHGQPPGVSEWWANTEAYEQAMAMYVKGVEPLVNLPPGFRQGLYVLPAASSSFLESAVAHSAELEQVHSEHVSSASQQRLPSPHHAPSRPSPLTLTFTDADTHLRTSSSGIASPQSVASTHSPSANSSSNSSPSGSWVVVKRELENDSEKCRKNAGITDDALAGAYKELLDMMGWSKEREAEAKKKRVRGSGNEDHKRAKHIASEKKRRGDMNEAILMLRDMVPPIRDISKATKIDVLHETADFLQRIQQTACLLIQENKRLAGELAQATGRTSTMPHPQPQPTHPPPAVPQQTHLGGASPVSHSMAALGLHPHAFAQLSLNSTNAQQQSSPPQHQPSQAPHQHGHHSPHLTHPLAQSQPLPADRAHIYGQTANLMRHNGSHLSRDTSRFMVLSLCIAFSVYGASSAALFSSPSSVSSGSSSRVLMSTATEDRTGAGFLPSFLQLLISVMVFFVVFVAFTLQDLYTRSKAAVSVSCSSAFSPSPELISRQLRVLCLAPDCSLFSRCLFLCWQLVRVLMSLCGVTRPIETALASLFGPTTVTTETEVALITKYLEAQAETSAAERDSPLTIYGVAIAGICSLRTMTSSNPAVSTSQLGRAIESHLPPLWTRLLPPTIHQHSSQTSTATIDV